MDKYTLMKKMGNIQQEAYVRPITFTEGRVSGMAGFEVKNGDLRFLMMADKCLDIGEFSYKGVNFNFLSKPGLTGRMDFDTYGAEGTSSLMGGLFFTCGLENTCLACKEGDISYPMHGRARSIPTEQRSVSCEWLDGEYVLSVSGRIMEGRLFGPNLAMKRTIKSVYGTKEIHITDEIENLAYTDTPMMILYHFNLGYPLLDEGAEVLVPTKEAQPRDAEAQKNKEKWNYMEAPQDNEPERVYLHELAADENGNTFACLVNHDRKLGIKIKFNKQYLPRFVQWKSIASGDYVMGLEPTNSGVYGRTDLRYFCSAYRT